jgi:hypothetical protein
MELAETRRLHELVRQHWASVKENRQFPRKEEIEPEAIAAAWEHCFIVEMKKGAVERGFHYDYMGDALVKAYGQNMTSIERCDTKTVPHIALMLRQLNEVAESGEPAVHETEFENVQKKRIKYRCCLLPLGADKVEYVLGCMRWRMD